jgi:heme exporter protein D
MMEGDFFAMGGYAFYVWLAYGLSAAILIVNAVLPARREKRLLARIAQRARDKQGDR